MINQKAAENGNGSLYVHSARILCGNDFIGPFVPEYLADERAAIADGRPIPADDRIRLVDGPLGEPIRLRRIEVRSSKQCSKINFETTTSREHGCHCAEIRRWSREV
jgi:hypothetical protein